jgi:hypothetical protein
MKTHPFWLVGSFWGTGIALQPQCWLNSQTVTAFGAARGDHFAPASRTHTDQETVGALAAND